jgi:hypothetical protein
MKAKRIIGALLAVSCPAITGCSGNANNVQATPSQAPATANRIWTAEDLRSALAPTPRGYEPVLPPEAGSFASVMKLSNPAGPERCLSYISPGLTLLSGGREVSKAPTANVVFVPKNSVLRTGTIRFQGIGETLLSLSKPSADRLIGLSVPPFCRQFTAPSSIGLAQYRLITCKPISIGTAGKIIGYGLYVNGSRIGQQWALLFESREYVGAVSAVGARVNDQTVVRLAQSAHTHAERALQ